MTEKYPSDNEDGAGGDDGVIGGPGIPGAVTEKYPSDNEDGVGGDDGIIGEEQFGKFVTRAEQLCKVQNPS